MPTVNGSRELVTGKFLDRGGWGSNIKHPESGGVGDGVTDDRGAFVIEEADTNADIVDVPKGTWKINSDITLTKGYRFAKGAILAPVAGVTVTINGPVIAGFYQIFGTTGAVKLGPRACPEIYTEWWGARGNGVNDDSTAFQHAVNSLANSAGGTIKLGKGTYVLNSAITISSGHVRISGQNWFASQIHVNSATNNGFSCNGGEDGQSGLHFDNFQLICFASADNTRTAGTAIAIANYGDYSITDVWLRGPWIGIDLNGANTGVIENVVIDRFTAITSDGDGFSIGILLQSNTISTLIRNVRIAGPGVGTTTYGIWADSGTDTLVMEGCGIDNVSRCYRFADNAGTPHAPRWVRMTNCYAEPLLYGVEINAGYDIEISGLYCAGNLNTGTIGVLINGGRVIRIKGGCIFLCGLSGIQIDVSNNVSIEGTDVADNGQDTNDTYAGVAVGANQGNFKIIGIRSGNFLWNGEGGFTGKQKYGIQVAVGTADNYIISLCDLLDNITDGLLDGGTGVNKFVDNNIS